MPLMENEIKVVNSTTTDTIKHSKNDSAQDEYPKSPSDETIEMPRNVEIDGNSVKLKPSLDSVNYHPETVDFPDSPQPRKRLSQPEKEFRDPLTNHLDEDEDDSLTEAYGSPLKSFEPTSLDRQKWMRENSADEYFEDSFSAVAGDDEAEDESFDLNSQDWSRLAGEESELAACNGGNLSRSGGNIEPMSLQSNFSDQVPDTLLLGKIKDCFDQEKIKDLYVLSGRLQDLLSPMEIEEIVMNGDLYNSYIDDDMFEAFSAAHAELSSGFSRNGSVRDSRRKIKSNLSSLVPDDIQIRAVFDCHTNSLRNSMRRKKPVPIAPSHADIRKVFEDTAAKTTLEEGVDERKVIGLSDQTMENLLNVSSTSSSDDAQVVKQLKLDDTNNTFISVNLEDEVLDDFREHADRPESLPINGSLTKRKIRVNSDILKSGPQDAEEDQKSLSSVSNKSDVDVLSPVEDLVTPDDIDTPEEMDDSIFDMDRIASVSEMIPELTAIEELQEERSWKTCLVGGVEQKIDIKVIEPYKKVLSHGGYFGPERHAIIVFSACYLPDHSRRDYDYVMDNLFMYVLTTLDQLVAEDYILVYLHGATDRNTMPTFGWLKRCYQMIDRRLRKNLKGLYLVHPTFWLKTIVIMTRPFISTKFYRKLKFVNCLRELSDLIPMDHVCIPDKVKQYEEQFLPDL